MSLVEEQGLFLQHMAKLIDKAHDLGLVISAGELYRTTEQQKLHIQAGRSSTMNSQHLKRLAADLNFFIRGPHGKLKLTYDHESVRQLGAFWESIDSANRWGGNWETFKDTPHFERREGVSDSVKMQQPQSVPEGKGLDLLAGTVGYHCDNHRDDVELVQRLLNLNEELLTPEKPLICDGIYGTKTRNAIVAFEKNKLGEAESDRQIGPRDITLQALCEPLPNKVDETFLQLLYLSAEEEAVEILTDPITDCMTNYSINPNVA